MFAFHHGRRHHVFCKHDAWYMALQVPLISAIERSQSLKQRACISCCSSDYYWQQRACASVLGSLLWESSTHLNPDPHPLVHNVNTAMTRPQCTPVPDKSVCLLPDFKRLRASCAANKNHGSYLQQNSLKHDTRCTFALKFVKRFITFQ